MSDLNMPDEDDGIQGDPPHDDGAIDEEASERQSPPPLPLRAPVPPPD